MAGLVAADWRGGTRGGRSFAQVRSLRPGAGQAGRVGCAPRSAPGHRWETSLELSLPGDSAPPTPWALTPAAWAPPRRPLAPEVALSPPPPSSSPGGFRIWTGQEERLRTLPPETPPHWPR
uniref:Uncharacterized protein n=1 Tax=Rangifer tarandus platyrhynchus TaxID=3082113 RepID=A0ACB0ELJ7_RANTA|nr:unnamed protein product [Rangifer tarandus platyrhynchus]